MSYPVLYKSTETQFATNGVGILADTVSCLVKEERNGEYELEMEYPADGIHFEDLALRMLILAKPNNTDAPQPFRIYRISRPLGGIVTVNAQHISYDLSGMPLEPFTAKNAADAMQGLKSHITVQNNFEFWTDKKTVASMAVEKPITARAQLGGVEGSVLDIYGGEYKFDRFRVNLYNARGADRGVSIRYGKNLTDIKQEENCSNIYTGIYPFWTDSDGNLVQLPEKTINAPGTYDFVRIMTLDLSNEYQEKPTLEQIRARAESYIKENNIGIPKVAIDVSFVQLERTEEYKTMALFERIELCDTVSIEFPSMGISATAKIIATTFNVLTDRYDTISIGDAHTTLADTIVQQQKAVAKAPTTTAMQQAIKHQTDLITGNLGGYVVTHDADGDGFPDELLVMDQPGIEKAQRIWRWNLGGLGYSGSGYSGPYKLGMNMDGQIVADLITTGTLDASLVKVVHLSAASIESGTMTLGGKNNGNALLSILDNNGAETGRIDNNGLHFTRGSMSLGDGAFSVDDKGHLVAANASISGGTIGGWTLSATRIRSSASIYMGAKEVGMMLINEPNAVYLYAQNANGQRTFSIDRTGNATFAGSLSAATGTFAGELQAAKGTFAGSLSAATGTFAGELKAATGSFSGTVEASAGHIGEWTINNGNIYNGKAYTGQGILDQNGIGSTGMGAYGSDWAFWAGDGRFSVKQSGKLHAEDAEIKGNVEASSGKIGEWVIASNNISNGLPYTGAGDSFSTGMGSYSTTATDGAWAFWAGNGRYSVKQNGHLHAEDADITGTVNANAGVFNSVTINGSTFSGTLDSPGGTLGGVGGSYVGSISSDGTFTGMHSGGSLSNTGAALRARIETV